MGKRIPLEGATNFRDLGDYPVADGRSILPGQIYRSDALHALTDCDHAVLAELNIRLICDLRYGEEREREPSRLPSHRPIEVVHLGLATRPDASFADSLNVERRTASNALAYLTENYRQYPRLYSGAYRTVLERLLSDEPGAIVFHCTAGKDRAGVAAVIVLMTLGATYQTVLEDYLKTNQYWDRGERAPSEWPREVVEAIFTAREEYLQAALATIDEDFGSFDGYLSAQVGFSDDKRKALQAKMLR